MSLSARHTLLCLGLVVLAGAALRIHDIERIPLWLDETDFFDENVYRDPPQPLLDYALEKRSKTTNQAAWFGVVWLAGRTLGKDAVAARIPALVCGVLLLPAVYLLVLASGGRRASALIAAAAAAISIPLIEYSQRTYAYGAAPVIAAWILLAHLNLAGRLKSAEPGLYRAWAGYGAAVIVGLFVHLSLAPLIAASAAMMLRRRRALLTPAAGITGLLIAAAATVNAKHPAGGQRIYLGDYYTFLNADAVPFLATRAYDLLAWHMNLFYDPALYWPLALNPVLIPLIVLCLAGWALAAAGLNGPQARELALVAAVAVAITGVLAMLRWFPFGGVRQTLFLAPALLAFLGLGFGALRFSAWSRIAGAVLALSYLAGWAVLLPKFYSERTAVVEPVEIERLWDHNGNLPVYAAGGSEWAMRYLLRKRPEITVQGLPERTPDAPFLLLSPHWPLDRDAWEPERAGEIVSRGYRVRTLMERPAAHLEAWRYPTCLYFPPNGMWAYRIDRR